MKNNKIWIILALAVLYFAVPMLLGANLYVMSLLVASIAIGGVALAWALLGNLGGMVSFGHAAFFGVGSYVSALLSMKLGLPVFAAMLFGGVGAAIASIAMLPTLRLKGPYFALAILAYARKSKPTVIWVVTANSPHSSASGEEAKARCPTPLFH